jgi:hypothetical protein
MMSFKSTGVYLKAFAIFCLTLLMAVGCSETPLGVSSDGGEPQVLMRSADFVSTVSLSPAQLYVEQVVSAKEGGQLSLFDVVLDIPPGAVDNDTLFSIGIPDINVFYNEFGTSGLVFNEPVRVTMSYRSADLSGVNESTIRIGWYNPTSGRFENVICDVDFKNKVVTGEVDHFSAYALISDEQ